MGTQHVLRCSLGAGTGNGRPVAEDEVDEFAASHEREKNISAIVAPEGPWLWEQQMSSDAHWERVARMGPDNGSP